jgi:Uncharacterised nucleotidyltransferase
VKIIYLCYSFLIVGDTDTTSETWITNDSGWFLLQEKAMKARAARAFTLFRENGIEPILIKGLAAARFYPEPGSRASVDMDLAVSVADFEAASKISVSAAASGLAIDIHRELRHLDTRAWDDLFSNSQLLEVDDGEIRVLRPEDNLRVLCVHWLTDGGAHKHKLWDIYYAVENRPADFDWDRFLNSVRENRRRWLICTVGLAHHFLGLNIDDTPIKDEAKNLPDWIIKTVEREWADSTRMWPLYMVMNDPKVLFQQIRKRLQFNPIWATVQMEGSFDARTRLLYHVGSLFKRMVPSLDRIAGQIIPGSR